MSPMRIDRAMPSATDRLPVSSESGRTFASRARLAVVIPVHNRCAWTARCVNSLRLLDGEPFMVVVVDDGSTDGTAEYLQRNAPDVIVESGNGDLWWSGGVNAGCDAALARGAEYLVLFNNDNFGFSRNVLVDLQRTVDSGATCACSTCLFFDDSGEVRVLQGGGIIDWHSRGPELRQSGAAFTDEYRRAHAADRCAWLSGMALAFRAETFRRLGGFDARRFHIYRGDLDFTLRATHSGGTCVSTCRSWVINDLNTTGTNFFARMTLKEFLTGLVTRRSPYQLSHTVRFAWRHCPKHLVPFFVAQFYARYVYAALRRQLQEPAWRPMPTDEALVAGAAFVDRMAHESV